MTSTSGEREAIVRLTAERDNIRGIADRWRDLCEKATRAAKVAVERAEASEADVIALRKKLAEKASGDWWCLSCDTLNGRGDAHCVRCSMKGGA